jgi:hypothetical protein
MYFILVTIVLLVVIQIICLLSFEYETVEFCISNHMTRKKESISHPILL